MNHLKLVSCVDPCFSTLNSKLESTSMIPWAAEGLTLLDGSGYREIGNLVILCAIVRPETWAPTIDSPIFSVPSAYQSDAPLSIFDAGSNPNTLSAYCRIAGGYVRAGLTMTLQHEYTIFGIYYKQFS